MPGTIIVINGISSSGKTSVAKALQETTQHLYLCVALDAFYALLPDWFRYSRSERWPIVNLQLQEALFKTVETLASQGHNVIVDTVLIDPRDLQQCARTLRQHDVRVVGLHCPLEEAEQREQARGDRVIGMARWQHPLIHQHNIYDLEIDTSRHTPQACAATIQRMFDEQGKPRNALAKFLDDPP